MKTLLDRRSLLGSVAAGSSLLALPAWARGADLTAQASSSHGLRTGFDEVSGEHVHLRIGRGMHHVQGRSAHAVAINGSVPGPLIRLREGQHAHLMVENALDVESSIHWHGLLVPFQYDGVPGISFPGIAPGETFTASFPVRQAGTYWWHSHSGLQEQTGLYGPLIIEPARGEPVEADADYVLLLSDFTSMHPHTIFDRLKKGEAYFNRQQTSWTDAYPLTGEQRRMWARMRMMPTDISDVTGSTYTFLANGRGPDEGTEFAFRPGQRVRLRVINGSAMTFFNLRIPGLPLTVIAADGQNVRPVEVDELQIGIAETYDLLLEPGSRDAYSIVAEAMDRSGMALATLAARPGARADVPALRAAPLLTMADMGMNHGNAATSHSDMAGMDHGDAGMGDGMKGMSMRDTSLLPDDVQIGPGIDMVAMMPVDRMDFPGLGLDKVEHRTLDYRKLVALAAEPAPRDPTRLIELHLTGNMDRYMWSFDGKRFSSVTDEPIRFAFDERVRVKLVNDTMMAHPIHLHGHFFELVNGAPRGQQPRKHTLIVQPGGSAQFDLTANEPGDWAFHCHLLYHMHAGMFQVVTVASPEAGA